MIFLHEIGCEWDENSYLIPNEEHIDIITYLIKNGCPWDETVCCHAVEINSFKILQLLHEAGCPWDETVY